MAFDFFSSGLAFLSGIVGSLFALAGNNNGQDRSPERPARIVQQLGAPPVDTQGDNPVYSLGPFPCCTEASDLRRPGRRFTIVTTAALPWRTGPAVNALLRALHLAKKGCSVVLRMPWIAPEEQRQLFMTDVEFPDRASQEKYIREWCATRAGIDPAKVPLEMRWYDATYAEAVRSIFPNGDISKDLGAEENDVLILEEPEHLCWYHEGQRWPDLFRHVIGVVHTNYQVYLAGMGYEGLLGNPSVRDGVLLSFTSLVCSAYCDVTIKLSNAGTSLPNDVISNVHGVRDEFLRIGRNKVKPKKDVAAAYFIGKAVMPKGWGDLLDLLEMGRCQDIAIDCFGSGPDYEAILNRANGLRSEGKSLLQVLPEVDHADERLRSCSVLVNPSVSEILCTVTAEALAMGKRAVLPRHPCNRFFWEHFPERCHLFDEGDAAGFEKALRGAVAAETLGPLSETQARLLSWDDAVDRLCSAAEVHVLSGSCGRPSEVRSAQVAYEVHHGFQRDTPALSKLLQDATMKSRSPLDETLESLAQWSSGQSGELSLLSGVWPVQGTGESDSRSARGDR